MPNKEIPQGTRKFIRKEKARIRREILDLREQKELIQKLYKNFLKDVKQL